MNLDHTSLFLQKFNCKFFRKSRKKVMNYETESVLQIKFIIRELINLNLKLKSL